MKLLTLAILLFSTSVFANYDYSQAVLNEECKEGVDICSEYTLGTDSTQTHNVCQNSVVGEASHIVLICPMMKELNDAGFKMTEFGHDHGLATVIEYQGNQIDLGLDFMAMGEAYDYELPQHYKPSWADWGTANSVYEYRYQKQADGSRKPFAIIYRRNFTSSFYSDVNKEWEVGEVTSAMIVVALNGAETTLLGTVDSIKARAADQNANLLARDCADSLVGAGNANACTVYKAH